MGGPISNETMTEINISAVLSKYVYANDQDPVYQQGNMTIAEIIKKSRENGGALGCIDKNSDTNLLETAAIANGVDGFILVAQSTETVRVETQEGYEMREIISCAFKNPDNGDIYIVYRGTGDGKWVDNGDAFTKYSSLMQQRATEFFNQVVEQTGYNKNKRGRIIVTGHSKGGNLAQFVTMDSKYGDLIDNCYSIDGQGFSQTAIKGFKERWKDDYQKQIDKMYSINGANDYVHDLGITIISETKTYFIPTSERGFGPWHSLDNFFFCKGDNAGKLRWELDENGVPMTEQGPVGKLAKKISGAMMALDEESLDDCAVTVMFLLELFMGDEIAGIKTNVLIGTGDRTNATAEDIFGFIKTGIPLLVSILKTSGEEIAGILELLEIDQKYIELFNEIREFAAEKDVDLLSYIAEDPLRIVEIYMSLDISKQTVNEAIAGLFTFENIAAVAAILSLPQIGNMIKIIVASTIVALVSNHILVRFKDIVKDTAMVLEYIRGQVGEIVEYISGKFELLGDVKNMVENAVGYIEDKVSDLYNGIKAAVSEGIEFAVSSVLGIVDEILTKGFRCIVSAYRELKAAWENPLTVIGQYLKVAHPIFYSIASKVYRLNPANISINITMVRQCVNTLYNLANKVSRLDTRLDSLYYKLSKNSIEQGEGVFTSLACMYNLFRADLNIDGGNKIRKKARELGELLKSFEKLEAKLIENVPERIY